MCSKPQPDVVKNGIKGNVTLIIWSLISSYHVAYAGRAMQTIRMGFSPKTLENTKWLFYDESFAENFHFETIRTIHSMVKKKLNTLHDMKPEILS